MATHHSDLPLVRCAWRQAGGLSIRVTTLAANSLLAFILHARRLLSGLDAAMRRCAAWRITFCCNAWRTYAARAGLLTALHGDWTNCALFLRRFRWTAATDANGNTGAFFCYGTHAHTTPTARVGVFLTTHAALPATMGRAVRRLLSPPPDNAIMG